MRVSPQSSNRMVDGARSVLNDLLADVYIFTDHMTGPEAGQSPGYGLMLVAETTTGCFISSECTANAAFKVGKNQCSSLFGDYCSAAATCTARHTPIMLLGVGCIVSLS